MHIVWLHVSVYVCFSISGWKGVRRRVSQRPGAMMQAETGTERPKPGALTMTRPSRSQIPSRSPSPPPNWACAARSAPPPAAASHIASQWRSQVSLAAAMPIDTFSPLFSVVARSAGNAQQVRLDAQQDPVWLPPFSLPFLFCSILLVRHEWSRLPESPRLLYPSALD